MPPSSHTRRSRRTAVRVFVLLFVVMVVGFYLTVGPDVVDLLTRALTAKTQPLV
jgi:type VI protein secretion system component VasF